MFDEYSNSDAHDVTTCICFGCVLTRYWRANSDVLAPEAQERVARRSVFVRGADSVRKSDIVRKSDSALLEVWGDVFNEIAESERIDRIIRYQS